jgi:hypothetical protein
LDKASNTCGPVAVLVLIQGEMDNVRKFVGLNTQIWTKQELVLFLPLLNGLLCYIYQLLNIGSSKGKKGVV